MTLLATIYQASLSDPPATSAISAISYWLSDLLFGPLATIIAVIAIAWVGFAMLSGRVDIRRGLSVVFGCFLLFGAKGIADGLRSASSSDGMPTTASVPPRPDYPMPPPSARVAIGYDPYAGAAVGTTNVK